MFRDLRTSLRFFCFKIAKRKRAMALSLLGAMVVKSCVLCVIRYRKERKREEEREK